MSAETIRGLPDWGSAAAHAFTGIGDSDLENAARQWWPLSHVYRGEVHYIDDFEADVLHWYPDRLTAGAAVDLVMDTANSHNQSVRLTPPTNAAQTVSITRTFATPQHNSLGTSTFFAVSNRAMIVGLELSTVYSGHVYTFGVHYNTATNEISVRDATGSYVVIGSAIYTLSGQYDFSQLQIVVDAAAGTYKRLVVGGVEIIHTGSGTDGGTSSQGNAMGVSIIAQRTGAGSYYAWFDDLIITRNEQ